LFEYKDFGEYAKSHGMKQKKSGEYYVPKPEKKA